MEEGTKEEVGETCHIRDTNKNVEIQNLSASQIQDPLRSKLLLVCRKAKELFSDSSTEAVSVIFPAATVRTDEYVPLMRGIEGDGSWISSSEGAF